MLISNFFRLALKPKLIRNFSTSNVINQEFREEPSSEECTVRLPPCQMGNMMEIGSRTIFDEDRDIFRSSVRRFMQGDCFYYEIEINRAL